MADRADRLSDGSDAGCLDRDGVRRPSVRILVNDAVRESSAVVQTEDEHLDEHHVPGAAMQRRRGSWLRRYVERFVMTATLLRLIRNSGDGAHVRSGVDSA